MYKIYSVILLSLCLFSCKKDNVDPVGNYQVYTIHKGSQSSNPPVRIFSGKKLKFHAKFDSTAIYNTVNPKNQHDINKLYGFSDCSSKHQENSARFGWRWLNNELQIFAYTYNSGQRKDEYITSLKLSTDYFFQIELSGSTYVFTVNNSTVKMPRHCSGGGGVKYYLYPYFGGDESAPHDIAIRINEDN